MNANQFALDIEAVLGWVKGPVLLYGHSAGAAGAIIAASRRTGQVRLLFLEGCYPHTRKALHYLYQWVDPFFGTYLAPMILFWMNLIYLNRIDDIDPARLAPKLSMPVLQIHGEKDRRFPLHFALKLTSRLPDGKTSLFIGKDAGHSTAWQAPGYAEAVTMFLDRHRF
jgi:pimeloyl-ACP methyl ester carboxylesterase